MRTLSAMIDGTTTAQQNSTKQQQQQHTHPPQLIVRPRSRAPTRLHLWNGKLFHNNKFTCNTVTVHRNQYDFLGRVNHAVGGMGECTCMQSCMQW